MICCAGFCAVQIQPGKYVLDHTSTNHTAPHLVTPSVVRADHVEQGSVCPE